MHDPDGVSKNRTAPVRLCNLANTQAGCDIATAQRMNTCAEPLFNLPRLEIADPRLPRPRRPHRGAREMRLGPRGGLRRPRARRGTVGADEARVNRAETLAETN